MGRKQIIEYFDDLTGETGDDIKPVTFGYQHVWYEIDLNVRHKQMLRAAIQPFIDKARPLRIPAVTSRPGYRKRGSPKPHGTLPKETLQAIRAHTQTQYGVTLHNAGRIAKKWIDLWRHDGSPPLAQQLQPDN